jgi:hypothetical protein
LSDFLVRLLQTRQPQRFRRRGFRRRTRAAGAGNREHAAGRCEQRCLEHARLFRGAVQCRREIARRVGKRDGKLRRLVRRVIEQVLEGAVGQRQAAVERAVDAHVEPALDAAADELRRDGVNQRARQPGDQREQQHETNRQARTEDPGLEVAPQLPELPADDEHQEPDQDAIDHQQRVVALREQRGVRSRGGEEEYRNGRQCRRDQQQPAQAALAGQRAHSATMLAAFAAALMA